MGSLGKLSCAMDRLQEVAPDALAEAFRDAHRASREEWERSDQTPCERVRFKEKVLQLMLDFAVKVAEAVHHNGKDATEGDAHEAMAVSLCIVADILAGAVEERDAVQRLQASVAVQCPLWAALLAIERKVELRKYADGYRTAVVRILANATYKNAEACEQAWACGLLPTLLQHTHLDEENPCLREWASFTISNMMVLPQVQARPPFLHCPRPPPNQPTAHRPQQTMGHRPN
eukprot:GGOE01018872.1.p2 GENE.GGOE01018872.1~~GGOE01018872.1.p2  ORF type:complete len:232 (-),score=56.53 GGOE01018872.1:271-966(-)